MHERRAAWGRRLALSDRRASGPTLPPFPIEELALTGAIVASRDSMVLDGNDRVSEWADDISGTVWAQSNAVLRPLFDDGQGSDAIVGRPAVRFTKASSRRMTASWLGTRSPAVAARTYAYVLDLKTRNDAVYQYLFSAWNGSLSTTRQTCIASNNGSPALAAIEYNGTFRNGPQSLLGVQSMIVAANNLNTRWYRNGTLVATTGAANGAALDGLQAFLGSYPDGTKTLDAALGAFAIADGTAWSAGQVAIWEAWALEAFPGLY